MEEKRGWLRLITKVLLPHTYHMLKGVSTMATNSAREVMTEYNHIYAGVCGCLCVFLERDLITNVLLPHSYHLLKSVSIMQQIAHACFRSFCLRSYSACALCVCVFCVRSDHDGA